MRHVKREVVRMQAVVPGTKHWRYIVRTKNQKAIPSQVGPDIYCLPLVALLFFASACSNVNLGDAVQLANSGKQAATTYENTITSTSTEIDRFREGQYLVSPLRNVDQPDPILLNTLSSIQTALSMRATMMAHLADVYTSFGALASYDAKG